MPGTHEALDTARLPSSKPTRAKDTLDEPRAPFALSPAGILALQHSAGNQAVRRLLQRLVTTTIQTSKGASDITELKNAEILDLIAEVELEPAKPKERLDELILAKSYLRKREQALDQVAAFEKRAAATSPAFPQIKGPDTVAHLRTTVEQPHLINQLGMAWCGPNTFLMVIARNDPVGYADYVIQLFETGKGQLGAMSVEPTRPDLKTAWDPSKAEGADWIAMGSLRDAGNWWWGATEGLGWATLPGDITGWFSKYGVPSEKIKQRGGYIARTDAGDIAEANSLLKSGWNVLLWVHMFTLKQGGEPKDITAFDIMKTHWVVLDGPITLSGSVYTCPVNTWGGKSANTVEFLDSKISSSIFGFIAVDMLEKVKPPPRK
jgi:hypothetical protein